MPRKAKPIAIAAAALAIALAAAALWWSGARARQALVDRLPQRPEASGNAALSLALARAESAVADAKDPVQPLGELAKLYHGNGYWPEATRCYELLIEIDPDEARWPHLLGHVVSSYGETARAIPLHARAVELAPDYLPARLRLADALRKTRRAEEAKVVYEGALERRPGSVDALVGLAQVAADAGDWQAAAAHLERAAAGGSATPTAWRLLGAARRALGQDARAKEADARSAGQTAELIDPWVDETFDYCYDTYRLAVASISAYESGDPERGFALLERAAEVDPQKASIQRDLGRRLMFAGRIPEAVERLERAIELDPADPEPWLSRAQIASERESPQALNNWVTRGLAHCPDSPGLHFEKGRILASSGRHDLAARSFQKSIELNPRKPEPHIELAGSLFRLGKLPEAEAALEGALRADPANPAALAIYARFVIGEKGQDEARALLRRALEHPEVPDAQKRAISQAYRARFGGD